MTDAFMGEILASVKNKEGHAFAIAKDEEGRLYYLAAEAETFIEKYCEGSLLRDKLAIVEWASWVTPAVVAKDFKWVGEIRNPYSISLPFTYEESNQI